MADETTDEIREKIREWFSREGSKVETISNPRAEFLFKVKFKRFFFSVVRPNDQPFIQVESQVMISPQHLKLLNAEKMKEFQIKTMRYSFSQDVDLGFIQPRPDQQQGKKPPGPGFVVSDRVYDDAFNEDRLWRLMRRVHSTVDMVIHILNDITGKMPGTIQQETDSGPSYYT